MCNGDFERVIRAIIDDLDGLHGGEISLLEQRILHAKNSRINIIRLVFEIALFDLRITNELNATGLCELQGLRAFTMDIALGIVQSSFLRDRLIEAQTELLTVSEVGQIKRLLLAGN